MEAIEGNRPGPYRELDGDSLPTGRGSFDRDVDQVGGVGLAALQGGEDERTCGHHRAAGRVPDGLGEQPLGLLVRPATGDRLVEQVDGNRENGQRGP